VSRRSTLAVQRHSSAASESIRARGKATRNHSIACQLQRSRALSNKARDASFFAATPCMPRALALDTEPYGSVYDPT
jgi:hypothetical protein